MGNKTCGADQTYESRFKNKYEFISLINDHNFGDVKIYRKKQLNFDYVMVLHKYVQGSKLNLLVKQIEAIHSAFLQQNQPMALRIFNFEVEEGQISNCSLSLVKIYVQYFSYTLHDLIQAHKQKGDAFTYDQLAYILNSCILTYQQFLDIVQKNLNLTTKCIYLSPQGCLKFCPIRPQQYFQHSNPMCNNFCNQTVYKQITNFERGQKYLLAQIKKIFSQIQELNFENNVDIRRIRELFQFVKKCHTIQMLVHKIGSVKIQTLNLMQKMEGSTVQQNKPDSRAVKSNSSLSKIPNSASEISEKVKTNESESVKLSLTKNGK